MKNYEGMPHGIPSQWKKVRKIMHACVHGGHKGQAHENKGLASTLKEQIQGMQVAKGPSKRRYANAPLSLFPSLLDK